MRRAMAAAGMLAVLLGGCSQHALDTALRPLPPTGGNASSAQGRSQAPTAASGPRSQVAARLTMPPGSELAQQLGTYFENWVVTRNRDSAEAYLAPQLPVSRDFEGRPWCTTVTTDYAGIKETKWVWGNAGDGVMVFVTGITGGDQSRVLVVTGATAGKNALGCPGLRA